MRELSFDKTRTAVIASELFQRNAGNKMVQERNTMENAKRVMDAARANGIPVIHVTIGFREGYPEVSDRNKLFSMIKANGSLKAGSDNVEFHELVRPAPGEVVVSRPRVNPFFGSELESVLRAHDVETIFIMGMSTIFSVEAAVRYAADLDYQVFLVEDCCAASRQEEHDWAVENVISRMAEVTTSQEFADSL